MRFSGKVCLVTGAGSGIGKAIALQFAREGGRVAVVDLNEEHGRGTVEEIRAAKGEAIFARCNVGEPAEVRAAVKVTLDRWQKIDVVVNDAAIMTFKPVLELPDEDWDKVLGVNLRSVFLFCKYAFIRGFSEEIAEKKIRINCVAPGAVDTPMLWNNPNIKSGAEKVDGAIGKPEDIAAAVCFLAAPEARFITGTTLIVDGGRLDILP